jgi:alkylation response protein AidB-like acyl-CoA dehydrogenase
MDFLLPEEIAEDLKRFEAFLGKHLVPNLTQWYQDGVIPRGFFQELGSDGWLGFTGLGDDFQEQPALKQAVLMESLAKLSPGVAVAVAVQISLGTKGLYLCGTKAQTAKMLPAAISGETLICLGNTEPTAGSDVASIATKAEQVAGGWVLNGTKAYVTNGTISDFALITAMADPEAPRNQRLSMFLVDLSRPGVSRTKLNKRVWVPSDLTRLHFKDVFVPAENLVGKRGRGLQQVLNIFTHSRISISALTLGTAVGAFEHGFNHAKNRKVFGESIARFQAKSFEVAHFFSRIEAARLTLLKACWLKDQGRDFRLESSLAKYLAVEVARETGLWAADIFGAASVMFEHPIHKYPMDAWAASLGEGTQDVQKLIIFRELMKKEEIFDRR